MREIKFKVRDRRTKQLIGYECLMPDIANDGWRWAKSYAGVNWEDGVNGADYHTRDQFTGLTDTNGNDIYEGDIVEAWSEGSKHIGEIRWRQHGCPCYIIFPQASFGISPATKTGQSNHL